jgi:hypothetical protein
MPAQLFPDDIPPLTKHAVDVSQGLENLHINKPQ